MQLIRIAHDCGLLAYENSSGSNVRADSIECVHRGGLHGGELDCFQFTETGELFFTSTLMERYHNHDSHSHFLSGFVIAEELIENRIASAIQLTASFYEMIDPGLRHSQLFLCAGLVGIESQIIERSPKRRQSISMSMHQQVGVVTAYDEPKRLSRTELSGSERLAESLTNRLRRRVDDARETTSHWS